MLKSISNKTNIRILVGKDCFDTNLLLSVPYGANIRLGEGGANIFLFDDSVLLVNSSSGKGALFRSAQILGSIHSRIFGIAWTNSTSAPSLMSMEKETVRSR